MANESPYTNDTSERNSGQSKPFRSVGEVAAGMLAKHFAVKPLKWEQTASNAWDCGNYSIIEKRGVYTAHYWQGRPCGLCLIAKSGSLYGAKDSVQRDHERRVLSCLEARDD